jgi:hypothetical protein
MDDSELKEARVRAEKAVAGMANGEMKLKAFEVILNQLITSGATTTRAPLPERTEPRRGIVKPERQPKSLSERIIALQADGFFKEPQTIGSVREGLKVHGWHYPVTTLSGALQGLIHKRKLRRERVRDKNKTAWKYFNP